MNLFQRKFFISHAGLPLNWKIECDALTAEDWKGLARMIMDHETRSFGSVEGIPRGGLPLAVASKLISFGLAYPWALCMFHKWRTEHTIINGKRLKFNGTGFSLIFLWIKWWFLSLITFGIYIFWVIPSLNRWVVEHTAFDEN